MSGLVIDLFAGAGGFDVGAACLGCLAGHRPHVDAPGGDRPWPGQAACHNKTDLFYPDPGVGGRVDYTAAQAICARCPVIEACLDWALTHGETDHGVWGGLTPRQRRSLRARKLG